MDFNFAYKHIFFYNFKGLNEKSKGNEAYIDLLAPDNRLDKYRQEKLKSFRQTIIDKFSLNDNKNFKIEDNQIIFNILWKENGEFRLDDVDYQHYLHTLHAAIFLRIKYLFEHHIGLSINHHLTYQKQILYNETLIHLTHYFKLSSYTFLGFENFINKNHSIKQWLSLSHTDEHHPLIINGNQASGKTLFCTKLVQYLLNTLGKNVQCIIRYFHLTLKSRHIIDVFNSICTQMKTLENVPLLIDDQSFNSIEYYRLGLKHLSQIRKPLIIMIDGIEDVISLSQYTSSINYYQALFQLLPPKVFIHF